MQQKTSQLVKFELTAQTREAIDAWIAQAASYWMTCADGDEGS